MFRGENVGYLEEEMCAQVDMDCMFCFATINIDFFLWRIVQLQDTIMWLEVRVGITRVVALSSSIKPILGWWVFGSMLPPRSTVLHGSLAELR
jgi:hypothetical protein